MSNGPTNGGMIATNRHKKLIFQGDRPLVAALILGYFSSVCLAVRRWSTRHDRAGIRVHFTRTAVAFLACLPDIQVSR